MVLKENKSKKEMDTENASVAQADTADEQKKSEEESGQESAAIIQKLTDQLAAEKERVLRLSAEFENYKKRTQRETDSFKKYAYETVFKQLLSVVDNLERAIVSAQDESSDDASLLEGVRMTHKEILKHFENFDVKPVEAENQPFDPNFHQAVTQEENNDLPDNTVTTVLQKGYTYHERLLRPAMVIVSKRAKKNLDNTEKK